MQSLPTGPIISRTSDVLIGLLPLAATVARYLPGGVAMPFRLISLGLIGLALMQLRHGLLTAARRTVVGVTIVGSCFVVFAVTAILRFGLVKPEDAAQVTLVIALTAATAVLVRTGRTLIALLAGWLASALLSAGVGVWEISTGNHLPLHGPASVHAGVIPGWNFIAAFFDNPNLYAYHCALSLLLLPALFVVLPRTWRWSCLPTAVLLIVLLAWTGGRIALFGLIIGAAAWTARHRFSRRLALAVVAVVLLLTWSGAPGFDRISATATNVVLETTEKGASVWVRIQLVRSAWWMAEQSDFLGVGPGGFGRWALRSDNPFPWEQLSNAHWGVAEIGAEYGIVTLGVFLGAAVFAAVLSWRRSLRWPGPVWSAEKVFLFVPVPLIVALPFLSASHSSWLEQPLSAVHLVTLVAFLAWGELLVSRACSEAGDAHQNSASSPDQSPEGA